MKIWACTSKYRFLYSALSQDRPKVSLDAKVEASSMPNEKLRYRKSKICVKQCEKTNLKAMSSGASGRGRRPEGIRNECFWHSGFPLLSKDSRGRQGNERCPSRVHVCRYPCPPWRFIHCVGYPSFPWIYIDVISYSGGSRCAWGGWLYLAIRRDKQVHAQTLYVWSNSSSHSIERIGPRLYALISTLYAPLKFDEGVTGWWENWWGWMGRATCVV